MVAQVDSDYIRTRPSKLFARLVSYCLFEGRPLTTRGQWINPLVFFHFSIEKHLPQLKEVRKPIFILGTGRSGTTILGVVLSMHKDVGFLNEPKALWHSIYPHEDLIGSYSRGRASYRLSELDVSDDVLKSAKRLFGAYLASSFSKRLVDKYPELIFRVPFVKKLFPDANFLFLVRNGWDTCHSIDGWSARLGEQKNGEVHDWWGVNNRKWKFLVEQIIPEHEDLAPHTEKMSSWTNHVDMAAAEWIVTMREGVRLERDFPDDVLRVNYESLCAAPKSTMLSIIDFCQLPSNDDVFFRYAESTLCSVDAKKPFSLAKEIEVPFHETMKLLGYSS